MRLGIDISTYFETLNHNAKFFDGGKQVDPIEMLRRNGVDSMRIRLWVHPYSEDGEPYLGGTCDFDNAVKLCELCKKYGFKIMLDFHYSDFWTDPGKQCLPKSWHGLTGEKLIDKLHSYTVKTLNDFKALGIDFEYIQVGNEITNGMLWDFGKLTELPNGTRGNYDNLIKLINAGIAGCREVYPKAKLVLHLERSYDTAIYDEFFTHMQSAAVDYDVIGFSYYPYWHGTMEQLFNNVDNCKKFGKELVVAEMGYAFTVEPFINGEQGGAPLVLGADKVQDSPFAKQYTLTPEGQAKFTRDFLVRAQSHGISAAYWWEPLWLHGDGTCWASEKGQEYIGEAGKDTRNEWANQCLFDYTGNKLPAFDEFSLPPV